MRLIGRKLENIGRRLQGYTNPPWRIAVCTHHKTGTVLMARIWRSICAELDWSFCQKQRRKKGLEGDVTLFTHSQAHPAGVRGVHVIRDPRDVIVSGFLYHLRCQAPWCVSAGPGQKSYQDILREKSQVDGLRMEMNRAEGCICGMLEWNYDDPNFLELHLEEFKNFDATVARMLEFLGLNARQRRRALKVAAQHNMHRMTDVELSANGHIHSRETTRWAKYLTDELLEEYRKRWPAAERLEWNP